MAKTIERWRPKDPITAVRLTEFSDNINALNREVFSAPKQTDAPPETKAAEAEEPEETVTNDNSVYIESSRQTVEVQIFDQNDENYALIDRVQSVTFTNADGDTLTLQFTE